MIPATINTTVCGNVDDVRPVAVEQCCITRAGKEAAGCESGVEWEWEPKLGYRAEKRSWHRRRLFGATYDRRRLIRTVGGSSNLNLNSGYVYGVG